LLLPNGKVLASGGIGSEGLVSGTQELFEPSNGTWTATTALLVRRHEHTATLLPNGSVLLAGGAGVSGATNKAEIYDPATGNDTPTGDLFVGRQDHTATLLSSGKVLFAGGLNGNSVLTNAEIYDPQTGTSATTGGLGVARHGHRAVLLPNGKVLIAGGYNSNGNNPTNYWLSSAELYDPATGSWTATGAMTTRREDHTMTLLSNGKVLVAGGMNTNGSLSSTEVYDPAAGTWKPTGGLNIPRYSHTATLLPNGKVLAAGGYGPKGSTNSAELYDPTTGTWTLTGSLKAARLQHTATLLLNGEVLFAGGQTNGTAVAASEAYDTGLGFNASWQSRIAALSSQVSMGGNLVLTGSLFRGISEGSCGNGQDSPSDYPLLQLRNLESGQTLFPLALNWSANAYTSGPINGLPIGYVLATLFVNGIPSTAIVINLIEMPTPTPFLLTSPKILANGFFQFAFTNSPGAVFSVRSSTNVLLPASNWTPSGTVSEVTPGQFQFIDSQTANSPQRFYRVSSP
jgi:hypothetical protein